MIFNKLIVFMIFYPVEFFVSTIALSLMFFAVLYYIEHRPEKMKFEDNTWQYSSSLDDFLTPTPILIKHIDLTESIEVHHR